MDENIDWHAFLEDAVLTDDSSSTTTTTTTNLEPPLVLRKHSPELTSWLLQEPICRSLTPSRYRYHHPSPGEKQRRPHARFARAHDLRRTASMSCARERIFSDDDGDDVLVPLGTRWPPGATGRLRHPPRLRPGAKGLRSVGFDVPRNYAGKKKVWSDSEWFVPEPTRLGREVWTVDERACGGIRVDDDGGEREEGEDVVMGGTDEHDAQQQMEEEGVAVDGEFDIPFPPLTRSSGPSYHGPLSEYAGYVSDDSDSDSDSDSDDGDSDDESGSSRFLGLGERMELDADEDDAQKITDAFAAFDGDHTGDDNAASTTEPAYGSRSCG